ncbi:LURP-one-related/scramblase family protein [Jeotgalibaca caeni]|uniref:LURP-one-related/scramblase family protein n=1 Tax=Jeotgalibaca caeni TaxID=3028623 RepID=UPI00237E62B2|nr:LURP-one-related family protein [Jeotgalibaca caeni]MDE1548619.1 LURP-one-related family protein [Jeotgalibaca caeni]
MKYYIKQKVFSWRDQFTVKDEAGNDVYFIEGELLSWGKKLYVRDRSGNEVLYIQQNIWNWMPNYTLFMHGQEVATVKKELTFLRPRYSILGPDWEVSGNVWEHDYEILEDGDLVASINKEWFTWGDSYQLDIADDSNTLLALGVIITIDCVIAAQQAANSSS